MTENTKESLNKKILEETERWINTTVAQSLKKCQSEREISKHYQIFQ